MGKLLVMLGAGVIGFLVAFSFVQRDEIGEEVERQLDEDFIPQCVARLDVPPEIATRKRDVCACMKTEFDAKGLSLSDTFGEDLSQMQEITRSCVGLYM